jgi:ribonuclease VapC
MRSFAVRKHCSGRATSAIEISLRSYSRSAGRTLYVANIVFDTSVVLALLQGEAITDLRLPHPRWASMSTVNVAEVWTLLEDKKDPTRASGMQMISLLRSIEPFDEAQARRAGELRRLGKNISLGDRACLALAMELGADVYTADHVWATFDIGLTIHLIR